MLTVMMQTVAVTMAMTNRNRDVYDGLRGGMMLLMMMMMMMMKL